jgi:hypothetical protein
MIRAEIGLKNRQIINETYSFPKLNIFFLNCIISQRSWSVLNHVFGKLKLIYATKLFIFL